MRSPKSSGFILTILALSVAFGLVNITLAQAKSVQESILALPLENVPDQGGLNPIPDRPGAILRVGTSSSCNQYPTLQAAVNAALDGDSIWVQGITYSSTAATVDMPDKNLTVIGGYDDLCTTVTTRTTLDASGTGDTVVEFQSGTGKTISLSFLDITGGGADLDFGGGIEISGNHTVTLKSVNVFSNTSDFGGGVYLMTGTLNLESANSEGSTLANNGAFQSGGGAYCINGTVTVSQGSSIGLTNNGNVADLDNDLIGDGGGVYLKNCIMTLNGLSDDVRVSDNLAYYGGGIFATNNSVVNILGPGAAVEFNKAVGLEGSGGGMVVYKGAMVTIDNASINNNEADFLGGGFLVEGGEVNSPTVIITNNSTIDNNLAGFGGGMYLLKQGATVLIDNSIVTSNTATERGGGIRMANDITLLTLQNGTIVSNNEATNQYGGGIAILYDGKITLQDVLIEGNTAGGFGGGIHFEGDLGGIPTLESHNSIIRNNIVTDGQGGGLYAKNSAISLFGDGIGSSINLNQSPNGNGGGIFLANSALTLTNMLIHDNTAGRNGGGIAAISASVILIDNNFPLPPSTIDSVAQNQNKAAQAVICDPSLLPANTYCSEFRDNTAGTSFSAFGGAVHLEVGSSVTADGVAFLGNSAASGGAFTSFSGGNSITVTNSLMNDNDGSPTIRFFDNGSLELSSSTLAGNPVTAISFNDPTATANFENNIIWDNATGVTLNGVVPTGSCNNSQDSSLPGFSLNPQFLTTTRGDYRLESGSPAIDTCSDGPGHDLDNLPRPQGALWDIGAFEFFNPAPVAVDDTYTGTVNSILFVPAPGVLGNDFDPNGNTLSAGLGSNPTHGLTLLNMNGSFVYTPTLDYVGFDSFTYLANNGLYTDTATVTINILPDRYLYMPLITREE